MLALPLQFLKAALPLKGIYHNVQLVVDEPTQKASHARTKRKWFFDSLTHPPNLVSSIAMSTSYVFQPRYTENVQIFHHWFENNVKDGIVNPLDDQTRSNPQFIPLKKLNDYLQDHRVIRLLQEILPNEPLAHRVLAQKIVSYYKKIFAILLRLGHGDSIILFSKHDNLRDRCLPFIEKPPNFPHSDERGDSLWHNFCQRQWAFCPYSFRNEHDNVLNNHQVLPTLIWHPHRTGGTASTFELKIHPDYNGLPTPSDDVVNVCIAAFRSNTFEMGRLIAR